MYYSQCQEDKIIYEKYLRHITIENGTFLEMGAMDGIEYSNTLFFEEQLGWRGILIEPHALNFSKLVNNRPKNKLYNHLVSNEKEDVEYMNYRCSALSAVAGVKSTIPLENLKAYYQGKDDFQKNLKEHELEVRLVKPVTLTYIIKDSGISKIDFFSLDVEGHEFNVLLSFDWSIPVNIFLIENNHDLTELKKLMESKNYLFIENVAGNSLWFFKDFITNFPVLSSLLKV